MSEFLAEARVIITPDTTAFRAQLVAELAAATRGVSASIPITITGATSGLARETRNISQATQEVAAAQQLAGANAQRRTSAERELQRVVNANTRAERALAIAQGDVANASTAVTAAQIRATRSVSAVRAAERALELARTSGNAALIEATANTLRLAQAQELEAGTALQATRAQAAHSAQLASGARGAAFTAATLLGVRGATLAANSAFIAGAVAIGLFTKGVQSAAQLATELETFRVTAQATAEEMGAVRAQAIALGNDISLPGVNAVDAARALELLARAGLSTQDAIDGARGSLLLATAAEIDAAQATELVASALNAFGLEGTEAARVADLLAASAAASQGSILDTGLALQQAAAVARQAGISLDDTIALITELQRAGLRGSDAGTSLRTALVRLIAPTDRAKKELKELNVELRDAQGNIRPEAFAELGAAAAKLGTEGQEALVKIFGQDAIRAISIFSRNGVQGLNDMRAATDDFGAAADIAGARTTGLTGSAEALTNALSTLGTELGGVATGPLAAFADTLTAVVQRGTETIGILKGIEDALPDAGGGGEGGFLGAIQDTLQTLVDPREQQALFDVLRRGELPTGLPTETLDRLNAQARTTTALIGDLNEEADDLFQTFREAGGGPSAFNQLVVGLDSLADKLRNGDEEAQRTARRIDEVRRSLQELGIDPTIIQVEARLDNLDAEKEAKSGADIILATLENTLSPEAARAIGFDFMQGAGVGLLEGADDVADKAVPLSAARITQAFEERLVDAELSGNRQQQLSVLRQEAAQIQAQIDAGVIRRDKRVELKEALARVNAQIASIEDGIVRDQEAATRRSQDARNAADRAFLEDLDLAEQQARNRIIIAQRSEGLQDDIRRNEQLRKFLERARDDVRRTVQDAQTKAREIASLTRDLIAVDSELARLRDEQAEAARQARQEARERAQESLELDVQIAQATGNQAAERRAREAEIAFIERQIRQTREGSLQRKRLILLLRQKQKELRDLKDEQKKASNAQAELAFEFLQAQQGFAANLFGNLIPFSASGGLVGNTNPAAGITGGSGGPPPVRAQRAAEVQASAAQAETAALAGTVAAPTRGQAAVTNDLLREVVRTLRSMQRGRAHPETQEQRGRQNAAMDYGI